MVAGPVKKAQNPSWLFLFLIATIILWRLPLYLNAEHLLWSDESANHLTIKHVLQFGEPYFYYHGMRYQGLTEGMLSLLFVPFFGFSALSQKLAGTLVYVAFSVMALRAVLPSVSTNSLRNALVMLIAIPPCYFSYLSFMAYGGHLLTASFGFLTLWIIWRAHRNGATNAWSFPISVSALLVAGIYTFRQFLIFYPVIVMFLVIFRGGLSIRSVAFIRNLLIIGVVATTYPSTNAKLGEWIQGSTYENLNSFMSFSSFRLNDADGIARSSELVFGHLLPTLLFSSTHWAWKGLSAFLGLLIIFLLVRPFFIHKFRRSDECKLLLISLIHLFLVLGSVLLTPYAVFPMDVRYLLPALAVLPFLGIAILSIGNQRNLARALWLAVALFATDTVAFHHSTGVLDSLQIKSNPSRYTAVIEHLRDKGVTCLYADYPDAYPISLITNEAILVSAINFPRIRRYEDCAERTTPRRVVLSRESNLLQQFVEPLEHSEIKYKLEKDLGSYLVFIAEE